MDNTSQMCRELRLGPPPLLFQENSGFALPPRLGILFVSSACLDFQAELWAWEGGERGGRDMSEGRGEPQGEQRVKQEGSVRGS